MKRFIVLISDEGLPYAFSFEQWKAAEIKAAEMGLHSKQAPRPKDPDKSEGYGLSSDPANTV